MTDYKSNSHRSKEAQRTAAKESEKKVEKVITGTAVARKKGSLRKFTEEFISEDAKNVKSYVVGEVLIPAVKKAISDIITNGIDMILYGGTRKGGSRSTADRVSYRNYYDRDERVVRDSRPLASASYSADDIILSSRGEAEEVLARMDELMDTYGLVRVADLYDLVGLTAPYTANRYGWTNIRSAEAVRVRDGYVIKMPRAVPID